MSKQVVIPWKDGNGNVILTYTGQGDGTIVVSSDTDNLGEDRQQDITVRTEDGSVSLVLTVIQSGAHINLRTSDGSFLRTSDGKYLNLGKTS